MRFAEAQIGASSVRHRAAKWFKEFPASLKTVSERPKPGSASLGKLGSTSRKNLGPGEASSAPLPGKTRKNSAAEAGSCRAASAPGKEGGGSRLSRDNLQGLLQAATGKMRKNSRADGAAQEERAAPKGTGSTYINRLIKLDAHEKNGKNYAGSAPSPAPEPEKPKQETVRASQEGPAHPARLLLREGQIRLICSESPVLLPLPRSVPARPLATAPAQAAHVKPGAAELETRRWQNGCGVRESGKQRLGCKGFQAAPHPSPLPSRRTSQGCVHIIVAQTKEKKFTLSQSSGLFDSVPQLVRHYASEKLPFKGAEHMTLLHPLPSKVP
uniref:Src homology 2 domain containing E n=1 Tax=Sphenodon punctatus TaxID=8508 RepID=A0A8D0GCG7_SPHPU